MNEKLDDLRLYLEGLTLRDRVIVFVVIMAVTLLLWLTIFWDPIQAKKTDIKKAITKIEGELPELEIQEAVIKAEHKNDPNKPLVEKKSS